MQECILFVKISECKICTARMMLSVTRDVLWDFFFVFLYISRIAPISRMLKLCRLYETILLLILLLLFIIITLKMV